mgnify:CR=1 FL=1|jgi:bleomycin hydrolase
MLKRSNLSSDFLEDCRKRFKEDPSNTAFRNAITMTGTLPISTDSNRVNEVSHVFMNSIKKKNLKATDQGHSGRCWMFAGLNMFRHAIINGMDIENFEFSETYLFFYDKFERSNTFLKWFIDNPGSKPEDRDFSYILAMNMEDGGWFNCFANLVNKYGLVPKDAMKETANSLYSEDMNHLIKEKLHSAVHWFRKNPKKDLEAKREEVMTDIYKLLVLFLGEPPHSFKWAFTKDENEQASILYGITPNMFKNMITSGLEMHDFYSLVNLPISSRLKYKTLYSIKETSNIYEGQNCNMLNMPIEELTKYAKKSILSGFPVWFSGDVSQDLHPWYSALDDKLIDHKTVFGPVQKGYDKGARLEMCTTQGNHAMTLTGVNLDENGNPINWQVENSWGYYDHETPGEDGWFTMSHSWFKKYLVEIVIHKNYLSRTVRKLFDQKPIELNPWDSVAPATRIGCVDAPKNLWKRK